jgi:hypothetical protein
MKNNTTFPSNEFGGRDTDPKYREMTIHRINEYNRLNIPMVMCGGTKNNNDKADRFEYTKDEWEAMDYIDRQLPLPEDLEKRLMDTLPERLARNKKIFSRNKW